MFRTDLVMDMIDNELRGTRNIPSSDDELRRWWDSDSKSRFSSSFWQNYPTFDDFCSAMKKYQCHVLGI